MSHICLYGTDLNMLRDFHVFSKILLFPLALLLLYSSTLRSFYLPLSRLVNAALILEFVCAGLFFYGFSNAETEGNCPEIILSRITTGLVMMGELHQVYFLSFAVGIANTYKINILGPFNRSISLTQMLDASTILILVSIVVSLFFMQGSLNLLMIVEDICTIFVANAQIHIISVAQSTREDRIENAIISSRDSAIGTFQSLSWIQLFLSVCCVVLRTGYLDSWIGTTGSVVENLDFICTYLFFLKVLLVKEKTNNLSIDLIPCAADEA